MAVTVLRGATCLFGRPGAVACDRFLIARRRAACVWHPAEPVPAAAWLQLGRKSLIFQVLATQASTCWSPIGVHLVAALLAVAGGGSASLARCDEDRVRPVRQVVVAKHATDFAEGEMREVRVRASAAGDDGAILVTKIDGRFYATGASCSHYSASLAEGVLARDRMCVVCPWHDAAFDLRTGQPVRGCGLNAIPTYPVTVDASGAIVVHVPAEIEDFAVPKASRRDASDGRTFIIVGGGAAGVAAADSLRQGGFGGRVLLLCSEKHLPYDRPVLSKNLNAALDFPSIVLREEEHFSNIDVELRLGARVEALEAAHKTLTLAGGERLTYDGALVCTGASARRLTVPGGDLPKVMQLRTPEDAKLIFETCKCGHRVVVVGSSFIGMELASTLKKAGCEVTVLGMEAVPFERVLGKKVGSALQSFFETRKVKFLGETVVREIRQGKERLEVATAKGSTIQADAVVVGVGVVPNADFVTGAEKARDGSLLADGALRTSAEGLYAAGDVVSYRCPKTGDTRRIEHWDVAMTQGRIAAQGLLGKAGAFDVPPFFWTSLFGKNLRYVGHSTAYDEVIIDGDISKLAFAAFYCRDGVVEAVATMARDPVAVAAGELMRMGRMPSAEMLRRGEAKPADFPRLLAAA